MPQPYDYSTQQVNVGNYFDALKSGREEKSQMDDATRQTALQKYMPGALNGDAEAQQQAFANATPDQAVQLKQALMQMEDRDLQKAKAMQDKFAGQAQWANTPERWAQVTQMAEAEGLKGAAQIPFELRGAKLAGMMTVKEQLDEEWKRRDFELKTRETNASVAAKNAAADASRRAGQGGGGLDNTTFDNISGLRKEFVGATKPYTDVRDAFGRIQVSAKNPSAAGDMSLIFNYMKMLDPGSTVREGEFATAEQATGLPDRLVNLYNKAISGQRLNPEQRMDFVGRAGGLFNRQNETYLSTKANYDRLAGRFGFDPSLVTFDQSGGIKGPSDVVTPPPPPPPTQRPIIVGPGGQRMQLNAAGTAWEPMR